MIAFGVVAGNQQAGVEVSRAMSDEDSQGDRTVELTCLKCNKDFVRQGRDVSALQGDLGD